MCSSDLEDKWKEAVAKALALQPDSLTVYQMEVPYNTGIYQQMKAQGKLVAPVADWATKRRWVDYAFREFERAGYAVNSTSTVVRDPAQVKFFYREGLFSGADLLSVGVASFGHINGVHYQNQADFDPYLTKVNAGELPIFRAYPTQPDERYIREFMLMLKLGANSRSQFKAKFGADPLEHFAAPLKQLQDWGCLTVDGDRLTLTREALLEVDGLLPVFFKPEHRTKKA